MTRDRSIFASPSHCALSLCSPVDITALAWFPPALDSKSVSELDIGRAFPLAPKLCPFVRWHEQKHPVLQQEVLPAPGGVRAAFAPRKASGYPRDEGQRARGLRETCDDGPAARKSEVKEAFGEPAMW